MHTNDEALQRPASVMIREDLQELIAISAHDFTVPLNETLLMENASYMEVLDKIKERNKNITESISLHRPACVKHCRKISADELFL